MISCQNILHVVASIGSRFLGGPYHYPVLCVVVAIGVGGQIPLHGLVHIRDSIKLQYLGCFQPFNCDLYIHIYTYLYHAYIQ